MLTNFYRTFLWKYDWNTMFNQKINYFKTLMESAHNCYDYYCLQNLNTYIGLYKCHFQIRLNCREKLGLMWMLKIQSLHNQETQFLFYTLIIWFPMSNQENCVSYGLYKSVFPIVLSKWNCRILFWTELFIFLIIYNIYFWSKHKLRYDPLVK